MLIPDIYIFATSSFSTGTSSLGFYLREITTFTFSLQMLSFETAGLSALRGFFNITVLWVRAVFAFSELWFGSSELYVFCIIENRDFHNLHNQLQDNRKKIDMKISLLCNIRKGHILK